jgi:hypothetical protein
MPTQNVTDASARPAETVAAADRLVHRLMDEGLSRTLAAHDLAGEAYEREVRDLLGCNRLVLEVLRYCPESTSRAWTRDCVTRAAAALAGTMRTPRLAAVPR